MKWSSKITRVFMTGVLSLVFAVSALAQTTEFTYQGSLKSGGVNANGNYDFIFALFDAPSGGSPLGSQLIRDNLPVTDGQFVVNLDFGSQFPGANRFLQISVRQQPNIHTQLAPRQQIRSVPYAIKTLNAENATTANNSLQLGGVAANQFVLTGDARLSDSRNPLPGSTNYIQNTSPGVGSNFAVTGTGSAEILNAGTQINIAGVRVLHTTGIRNIFAGVNSGPINSGFDNAFFGYTAGQSNQGGTRNAFYGSGAGRLNTTGGFNSFFGASAGDGNTTGASNSFFGNAAGLSNTTGTANSIFGESAGVFATTAFNNAIFGAFAGFSSTGSNNTFLGNRAGGSNTSGGSNTFVGQGAGQNNSTASENVFVGGGAGMGNTNGASNTYLGFNAGFSNTTLGGNTFVGWRAGFSSTGGNNSFYGSGSGANTTSGAGNSFFGGSAGSDNTNGSNNTFVGGGAGTRNTSGGGNSFFGLFAGAFNTTGNNNVFIGNSAGQPDATIQINNSVAIGTSASVNASNTIVLGTSAETTRIPGKFVMGANSSLLAGSAVAESFASNGVSGLFISNLVLTGVDAPLASPVHLCIRTQAITTIGGGSTGGQVLTRCSGAFVSDRFKENVRPFSEGLDVIKKLRPITFEWKEDGTSDIGLNAEDVASVEPKLVTLGAKGDIEAVKEHSLNVLFINAIKEQQMQLEVQKALIDTQQQSIKQLREQTTALTRLICESNPTAVICRTLEKSHGSSCFSN